MDVSPVYRTLVQLMPSGVILCDQKGRIREFNPRAAALFGHTPEAFARLSLHDLVDAARRPRVVARLQQLLRGEPVEFDVAATTASGTARPVHVSAQVVHADQQPIIVGVLQDLEVEQRTAEALRASDARLTQAIALANLGIWDWEPQSDRTEWNDEMLRIYGISREQFTGRGGDYLAATRADYRAAQRANIEQSFKTAVTAEQLTRGDFTKPSVRELCIVRPDGSERFTLGSAIVVTDGDGRPHRMLGVTQDVTEARQASQALRLSEERFRRLVEEAPVAVCEVRGDRVVYVNGRYRQLFGLVEPLPPGGVLAESQVGESELVAARQRLARLPQKPNPTAPYETIGRRPDGTTFPVEVAFARVDLPEGLSHFAFFTDLTTRQAAEQARAVLQAKLAHASKMESIGTLAGGVAHDFNNLLTVILCCVDALQHQLGSTAPSALEDVHEIRGAADRARDLTRQLLAFARKQVIAPVELDLNAVLSSSERMLRRVLGEDLAMQVVPEPFPCSVFCDPGQLEQVIMNLAVNARDAMVHGGTLVMETHLGGCLEARPGQWVRLLVRDDGVGLSPEVREHLFEPFFTTKEKGRGTGLGLATVHGIVAQNGGHIHVISAPGRGTTFDICLPRSLGLAPARSTPVPSTQHHGVEPLLVVEDDATVRAVTVRALRAGGYEVLVAESGRHALALDPTVLARVKLLVTDVVMPGMGGPEVARALTARQPSLKVLFVSGHPEDALAQRGVLRADLEFLAKPFTPTGLLARVRAVLDAPGPTALP